MSTQCLGWVLHTQRLRIVVDHVIAYSLEVGACTYSASHFPQCVLCFIQLFQALMSDSVWKKEMGPVLKQEQKNIYTKELTHVSM